MSLFCTELLDGMQFINACGTERGVLKYTMVTSHSLP